MGKRGPRPKGKVEIKWLPNFSYAIGLIATDGCLYNDNRHISLTTKDLDQAENFKKCLKLGVKIGSKLNGSKPRRECYHVQFGDVLFYQFLESIGLTKRKSKTLGIINIPNKYFFDFLRGCFDGDGSFYSYWDKRWKSSYMFYIQFTSASYENIEWLRDELNKKLKISGHITTDGRRTIFSVKYAKKEALEIIKKIYYSDNVVCLNRKKQKIKKTLEIENIQQEKYKLKNARVL